MACLDDGRAEGKRRYEQLLARLREAHKNCDHANGRCVVTTEGWHPGTSAWNLMRSLYYDDTVSDDVADLKADAEPTEPAKPSAELLTLAQAAAYLNITDEQLAAFVQDGTLDYINVGRGSKRPRIRFTKQDLDAFIDRRRQKEVRVPCPSTRSQTHRSITSTSNSKVIGFAARRAAQLAARPKPSKR